jgi:hypothetical protein
LSIQCRWAISLVAALSLAMGACRDSAGPEKSIDAAIAVVSVEGPTIPLTGGNQISIECKVLLRATATGDGTGTWQGGTLRFHAGRDRSEAVDTLTLSADDAAAFWQGSEIEPGTTQFGRFTLSASVPFEMTVAFEYRPSSRGATKTVETSFGCGPTLPDGAAGPAVTAVTVDPGSGMIEPGQTIRIDYSATSEIGLLQAIVEVSGACEVSDTSAIRLLKTVTSAAYITLPRTCTVGVPLTVEVTVIDGALEIASRDVPFALNVADLTPPTISPSFVPRIAANGTAHPEADYFVGDTLDFFFNATDYVGVAALIWEVLPSGPRDSIPVVPAVPVVPVGTDRIRIPIDGSWGSGPVRLRLYARDRAGFMSNVYTSPHEIRIHPTVVRPVRLATMMGGMDGLAIDSDRGILYFMQVENQRIAMFSLATMSVTGYASLATHLGDLDLTPNGDSLIVTLPAQRALAIIDLSGPTPVVSTVPLTVLDPASNYFPIRVRVVGGGRVLVGLEGTGPPARRVAEVNLGTNIQRLLPEPPFAGGSVFERSDDRSTVVFRGLTDHLQRYDAITDEYGPIRSVPPMWFEVRPSIDARGERILFGSDVFDRSLQPVSRLFRLPGGASSGSAVISPSGEFVYESTYTDGIVRYRASDGAILDRTPNPFRPGLIRVTSDGRWILALGGNGNISVIDMR